MHVFPWCTRAPKVFTRRTKNGAPQFQILSALIARVRATTCASCQGLCADLECIAKKIDECKNNPEKSSTTKVSKHIQSGFSMSTRSLFMSIENKHDVYKGKDCMKKFCESF